MEARSCQATRAAQCAFSRFEPPARRQPASPSYFAQGRARQFASATRRSSRVLRPVGEKPPSKRIPASVLVLRAKASFGRTDFRSSVLRPAIPEELRSRRRPDPTSRAPGWLVRSLHGQLRIRRPSQDPQSAPSAQGVRASRANAARPKPARSKPARSVLSLHAGGCPPGRSSIEEPRQAPGRRGLRAAPAGLGCLRVCPLPFAGQARWWLLSDPKHALSRGLREFPGQGSLSRPLHPQRRRRSPAGVPGPRTKRGRRSAVRWQQRNPRPSFPSAESGADQQHNARRKPSRREMLQHLIQIRR